MELTELRQRKREGIAVAALVAAVMLPLIRQRMEMAAKQHNEDDDTEDVPFDEANAVEIEIQ